MSGESFDDDVRTKKRTTARISYHRKMNDQRLVVEILQGCPCCGPRVNSVMVPVRDDPNVKRNSTFRVKRFRQKQLLINELPKFCKRCGPLVKGITG